MIIIKFVNPSSVSMFQTLTASIIKLLEGPCPSADRIGSSENRRLPGAIRKWLFSTSCSISNCQSCPPHFHLSQTVQVQSFCPPELWKLFLWLKNWTAMYPKQIGEDSFVMNCALWWSCSTQLFENEKDFDWTAVGRQSREPYWLGEGTSCSSLRCPRFETDYCWPLRKTMNQRINYYIFLQEINNKLFCT